MSDGIEHWRVGWSLLLDYLCAEHDVEEIEGVVAVGKVVAFWEVG